MTASFETLSHFVLTKATNEELNEIASYIKMRRSQLTKQTVRSVSKGAKVTFSSRGKVYNGTVMDVKIKNLVVETQYGRYRVPASMVTLVQGA